MEKRTAGTRHMMKGWLGLTTVVVLAASALHAQREDTYTPEWRAQWIWMPERVSSDMLLARKSFTLEKAPEQAMLSVAASSQYQLYVNGSYMGSGPARCAPHHQSYDTLDISSALREGKNVLAIRVHHQREGVSYYGKSRAGLLAQLDCSPAREAYSIQTDTSWRVSPDGSWQNTSPEMSRFHFEVCDRVDLRGKIAGWKDVGFDDTSWSKARVLWREEGWPAPQKNDRPSHLIPPWTSLVPRDMPLLKESVVTAKKLVHSGNVTVPKQTTDISGKRWSDAAPLSRIPVLQTDNAVQQTRIIPANTPGENRVLVYDLGEVHNGRPFIDIQGPAGAMVDIMCAPYLLDDNLQSPIVASTYVDRIVLSGERDQWEAVYWKPARWLAVVFRHLPEDATLYATGVRHTKYPFQQKGSFQTPDYPELQKLWDAAAKTIEVCTTDAYTDNYRERRQYAQTSYYAGLGNYPVFGDYALQRRYLKQISEEQLPNGIMPAYAPRHGADFMVILDSNCFWIRGLHQYLLYSGDRTTTKDLLPAARKLLDLLDSFTTTDGLIDNPPYPYWLDHALNDRRGANFCLNGHYLGALEDFAQVLQWMDGEDAAIYQQRAARIRKSLGEKLWDKDQQLFADALIDGELSDKFSEHANAMALALRIGTPEQTEAIATQMTKEDHHDFVHREPGVVMVTPAMSYFLHAGLCEAGYLDESLDLLWARFAHMLTPESNGTLWEEWWLEGTGRSGAFKRHGSGRSDAQTESAFPPALFARYILGIEPTQPGLREVVLRYYPSNRLLRHSGAIPTPSGLLGVAWEVAPTLLELTLRIPKGTMVHLDLSTMGMPSLDAISIDSQSVSAEEIKNGRVTLASGKHNISIQKDNQ
jgi:hypothetical protein